MWILLSNFLPQGWKASMRRVAVLFFNGYPCSLAAHKVRRRQIGLAKAEIDAVRQSALEKLAYECWL
jgi:hypothetical protein